MARLRLRPVAAVRYSGVMTEDQLKPQRPASVRLDPQVHAQVEAFRRGEYRNFSNAVNLLLVEALAARGFWPAGTTQAATTEAHS